MDNDTPKFIRRTEIEKVQVGDYFSGVDRYFDQISEMVVVKVFAGDCYTTDQEGEMLVTVLGSCIAACVRDPIAKVAGMNHFLLPDISDVGDCPTRYGASTMERLINDMLKKGALKSRMEVKVFGGGNIIKGSSLTGDKNIEFIKQYLKDENLVITQSDLGGTLPRRIHYYPDTGKVMMRKLSRDEDFAKVEVEESEYKKIITTKLEKGSDV